MCHPPRHLAAGDQLLEMALMTFDEELSRAADALISRLRDEIAHHVQAAAADIGVVARTDRDAAVTDARTAADRHASERMASAIADAEARAFAAGQDVGLQEGRTAGAHEAEHAAGHDVARLVDAMRTMDAAHSLTPILDALASAATAEAERAAVLLVRGNRAQVWRRNGFEAAPQHSQGSEFTLQDDVAGEAAAQNVVVSADNDGTSRVPAFAGSAWSECVCVPMALAGEVVAVLYVDTNDAAPVRGWRHRVELLTRHATRCLEAVVAFKAAQMLAAPSRSDNTTIDSDAADDETGARRYARLLVSEIRLYHEDAVAAGQRERDLATRLGGEIARARMLYEQRIAARVRRRADYFQDELVRTLANGDPALLELKT
jgi:hypothetical protein